MLYWHDPMVPNQHFDKPGKSPFMDMQLQPVYADEGGGASGIRIDQGLQQNLGIRYATVRRQQTAAGFDAVGTTQFDESRADVVQSRVTGYIDHLHARAPMQRIAKAHQSHRCSCPTGSRRRRNTSRSSAAGWTAACSMHRVHGCGRCRFPTA